MKWNETLVGSTILQKKYFHEGENFDAFAKRVSGIFSKDLQAKAEQALRAGDFFPAGRSLYGAGAKGKFKASMSNCYITELAGDSIENIYDCNKEIARIFSYGGGCGVNISPLRPKGSIVNNTARTSTGAVSFLELFNATGNIIGQHGRRGAMMIGLNCTHPDIDDFLKIKQTNHKLESANISILFTDEFMKAVDKNKEFTLTFDIPETGEHIEKTINARAFFQEFCETQWDYGDPGSIFIDTVKRHNLLSGYEDYKIEISNPCAEFYGNSGNSCNLGSVNLYNMVANKFEGTAYVDHNKLQETVEVAVKALDEILDYGYDMQPLDKNRKCIDDWRSIGLGVFGVADMLIALGLRYGSREAVETVREVMKLILITALKTSANLAKEKGTFGRYDWDKTKESPLIYELKGTEVYDLIQRNGLRHGTLISIAPTGSIATMVGLSGGCEPLFAISYERTTHALEGTGKTFEVYAKSIEDLLEYHNLKGITEEQIKQQFPFVVTSHDVNPLGRVAVQAVMQDSVDNAISSTVNLKKSATVQDIMNIYLSAWKYGCKGITVFRDGCKRGQILGGKKYNLNKIIPVKRSGVKRVNGSTIVGHTACAKNLYTTVNSVDGDIFETFTNASGGCKANISTITRLVSLALRSGIKVYEIVSELKANTCPACSVLKQQGEDVSASCGACIGEAIESIESIEGSSDTSDLFKCPKCNKKTLRPVGKCYECHNCGYSRCEGEWSI